MESKAESAVQKTRTGEKGGGREEWEKRSRETT